MNIQKKWIPFSTVSKAGNEPAYMNDVVTSGQLGHGGRFCRACEAALAKRYPGSEVLLTNSATSALEMAVWAMDLGPEDEVIMPSYTFVSTANAVTRTGARPRFVDLRPDTMNLSADLVRRAIGPRTKAIMPVHYAGVACDPEAISTIAEEHGLVVIEDAAHCYGASFHGRPLGTFGAMAAISFDIQKNVTCGEGGALIVNDRRFLDRVHVLRDMGTNRRAFMDGKTSEYSWVGMGSRYGMPELSAAFLLAQLERADDIGEARMVLWKAYRARLAPLARRGCIELPVIPDRAEHNAHIAYLFVRSPDERKRLIAHLNSWAITAVFHYVPLHTAPYGIELGNRPGDLPVTEDRSARLLRLPLFPGMTLEQVHAVCDSVESFYGPT